MIAEILTVDGGDTGFILAIVAVLWLFWKLKSDRQMVDDHTINEIKRQEANEANRRAESFVKGYRDGIQAGVDLIRSGGDDGQNEGNST